MSGTENPIESILHSLQERAKELHCLYRVDELLGSTDASLEDVLSGVVQAIPPGWQYPEVTVARVTLGNRTAESPGFRESPWSQVAPVLLHGEPVGKIEVFYTAPMPPADEGPFLKEERKLIDTLAERLRYWTSRRELRRAMEKAESPAGRESREPQWQVILDFLRQTDRALLRRIGRKMLNHLAWNGVSEADALLREMGRAFAPKENESGADNRPRPRAEAADFSEAAFLVAGRHLSESEILSSIQRFIKDERAAVLRGPLEHLDTPLVQIAEALHRFQHAGVSESELPRATQTALRVGLIRRFLTDDREFLHVAKDYLEVADFSAIAQQTIYPSRSHGRLGGKAAGLLLASKIVAASKEYSDVLGPIRTPRTWYVPSDGILDFIHHNDLDETSSWKYSDPDRVRQEYPHIVQLFKSSPFSPEMQNGLAVVLEDLAERPLIVRSSSALEDRQGASFSGKYKSLFITNQGSKHERLAALTDAIAEVYASVFNPDALAYRAERGLIDLHEEMGVMIQEVVGSRVGRYFLPAFSGVALSNNEFRWSPRITREDGLVRLVPGLGTRAVDRLSDDYAVLVAPGQPGLSANPTAEEALRYSPRRIDLIDLEDGGFGTVDVESFLRSCGAELPLVRELVSICEPDRLRSPVGLIDFEKAPLVFTFEGLIKGTTFVTRIRALLKLLREKLKVPVDIELASDGKDLYLLQCRPQSYGPTDAPAPIPRDLPREQILFSARRNVSNGRLEGLTHVVYVVPEAYAELEDAERLRDVARAVGRLNRLLPKRRFALMGPGRWGSRGDIKLGVPVTYADISDTALLVEIARKKGGYVPELSFGTHFFQDLVESGIRYLPLYPEDPGIIFNAAFLSGARNALETLAPDLASLAGVLRVIDLSQSTDGLVLDVLMNADLEEAIGFLTRPEVK